MLFVVIKLYNIENKVVFVGICIQGLKTYKRIDREV